jgi:hypothetical protein
MQRKIYLSALAILAAFGMTAKHVSPEEAMARAAASGSAKAPAAVKMTCTKTFTTANNSDALYIFKGGNNALVLPADDRVAPILGYFDGPTEGEMPAPLKWWLGEYVRQIEFLQSQPETSGSAAAPSHASTATRAAIAPLVTTKWNQSEPYNNQCPVDAETGETSVTGCVATAAAQVMNYYKYPTAALSGTITYVDYGQDEENGISRSFKLDGKKFDWANMLDRYTEGNYTDAQADAVAFLMAACGYASEMEYTSDESGTASIYFLTGAKRYFGYNDKAVGLNRDLMELDQWEDLLYKNLQTVGPLFYCGTDGEGGHAFVCDGYADGYFHFNWGWDGAYNGYFVTTSLKPEGTGIGGNSGNYSYEQMAMFNFTTPDAATIEVPDFCPMYLSGALTGILYNDYLVVTTVANGLNDEEAIVYNISDQPVSGTLAVRILDTATNSAKLVTISPDFDGLNAYEGSTPIYLPVSTTFTSSGEYVISFVFKEEGSDEWDEVEAPYSINDHFIATVDADKNITITTPGVDTPESESLTLPSVFYADQSFRYSYSLKNNGDSYISDHIVPYLCKISAASSAKIVRKSRKASTYTPVAEGEAVAVNIAPGETYSYTGTTLFSSHNIDQDAELYFILVSQNTNKVIAVSNSPVSFAYPTGTATIAVDKFTLDNQSAESVNPDLMEFTCGVTCTEGYFASRMYVAILDSDNDMITYFPSHELFIANTGETDSAAIIGSFSEAEPETAYTAYLCSIEDKDLSPVKGCDGIAFKTAKANSGLSAVTANKGAINIVADRAAGLVSVSAASDIRAIQLYALDGRKLAPAVSINGAAATINMAQLPAGVSLVKVTLSDNSTAISKIIK